MSAGLQLWTALRAAFYATTFVLLWVWLALSVRALDGRFGWSLPGWAAPLGIVLVLGGGAMGLSCVVVFVTAGRGTPAPFDPPRAFVAVGPYRFVRNPMYVGGLAVLLGSGLILRSVAIVGLALLFWGIAHVFVLLYEEPDLERRFGESYLAYKERVRRWRPRWRGTG